MKRNSFKNRIAAYGRILVLLLLFVGWQDLSAQCLGNCYDGKGEIRYQTGNHYKGFFKDSLPHGRGLLYLKSGSRFEGYFKAGKLLEGNYYYYNGDVYKGQFKNNKRHGLGRLMTAKGQAYEGYWEKGKFRVRAPYKGAGLGETYILVVSVNGDLQYTDEDAALFQKIAKEHWEVPAAHIIHLADEQATKQRVKQAATKLFAPRFSADRVIFYFSGHGMEKGLHLHDGLLSFDDLKDFFRNTLALEKWCIIDACHAASVTDAEREEMYNLQGVAVQPVETEEEPSKEVGAEVVLFFSARPEQFSTEAQHLKQGVFTYALNKALTAESDENDDKIITLTEWFKATQALMQEMGSIHNPVMRGQFSSQLPVLHLN